VLSIGGDLAAFDEVEARVELGEQTPMLSTR
jgi:hypothetical protein